MSGAAALAVSNPAVIVAPLAPAPVSAETLEETRKAVRDLLEASPSFRAMSADEQRDIAQHTVQVASFMAEAARRNEQPRGVSRDPYALGLAAGPPAPGAEPPKGAFRAGAAREGAAVAGALLAAVDFPTFVAKLIQGVFHAIVQSSIEQMEAYGHLVADVAKTLNQFRDENVSENQGRDHLVDQFPDTFMINVDTGEDGKAQPRVKVREGVDEDQALKKVNSLPVEGGPISSLDDDTIEEKLVPAARTQLATSRQQLLATMVMMGINRIVVTDGKIAAKVLYDFQARDNFASKTSATKFDYGDQMRTATQGDSESTYDGGSRKWDKDSGESRGSSYYSKGTYKTQSEPVVKLISATNEQTDAALTTKASLAGNVEVNFKSDYFPLEKMADSFQIGQIQNAAKPGTAGAKGAAGAAPGAAAPAAGAAPAPAAGAR